MLNEGKNESELAVREILRFDSLVYKKISLQSLSQSLQFSVPEICTVKLKQPCSNEGTECAGLLAVG